MKSWYFISNKNMIPLKKKGDTNMKVYAMSDIHGYLNEFENALSNVDLSGENILVLLGDYIHGPDSYGTLDRIIGLQEKYGADKVIALLGNHEEMALDGTWNINEGGFDISDESFMAKYEVKLMNLYMVNEKFPRLTEADLNKPEVCDVEYSLIVNSLLPYMED